MTPGSTIEALRGSIELAQFDSGALKRFDLGRNGFLRSFSVVLLMLPLFAIAIYLQNTYQMRYGNTPAAVEYSILILLLDWLFFVVLLWPICRFLGVQERYFGAMEVYNWCRPIAFSFFLPTFAAGASGLVNIDGMFLLYYLTLTLRSIYLGYILHVTLRVGLGAILAIVLLDYVLGQVIGAVLIRLL